MAITNAWSSWRQSCASQGGRELDPSIGQRWWERRYDFYHPPHAPELPQIWCTVDAVSDYAHIEPLYTRFTEAVRGSIDLKWNLSLKNSPVALV